jgi:hypothetical protein
MLYDEHQMALDLTAESAGEKMLSDLKAGNLLGAATTINDYCMQYNKNSDVYREAFLNAGVTDQLLAWFLTVSTEGEVYAGCRMIRALAGSPHRPELTEAFLTYFSVPIMNHIICLLSKPDAFSDDALEQIIGSLMNTLRPSLQVKLYLLQGGGLPALTGLLRRSNVMVHPRLALFTSYAVLSITRSTETHFGFREGQCLNDVKLLLSSSDVQVRAVGMMILANLAQSFDDPADDVALDVTAVKFIVSTLQETMHPEPGKYYGWKIGELVHALFSISASDTFKSLLVDGLAIPGLLEVLETAAQESNWLLAIQALHNLCFHHEAEEKVRNSMALMDPAVYKRIRALAHGTNVNVVQHVAMTLADLADLHAFHAPTTGRRASNAQALDSAATTPSEGQQEFDVMLSYSWASQGSVLQIRDKLVAKGLKVWIDVEHMGSNLMDSMASAVECSRVIIVCCSSAYKASPNCRREADYAAHLGKPMVIANMENGFVPRGWLGLHVAGKIWCDFREETAACFDRGMQTLYRQLIEHGIAVKGALIRSVSKDESKIRTPSSFADGSVGASAPATAPILTCLDSSITKGNAVEPTPPPAASPPPVIAVITASPAPSPLVDVPKNASTEDGDRFPPAVLDILTAAGHGRATQALEHAGFSDLSYDGLRILHNTSPSTFHELIKSRLNLPFADSLALAAALFR